MHDHEYKIEARPGIEVFINRGDTVTIMNSEGDYVAIHPDHLDGLIEFLHSIKQELDATSNAQALPKHMQK